MQVQGSDGLQGSDVSIAALSQGSGESGEAAPEEKSDLASEEDEWGKRFAHLTKKERQIIERERRIKESAKDVEEYRRLKALKEQDPLEFLKANGLTYEQLTEIMLSKQPKDLSPEDRIQKLQDELEKDRRERQAEKERAESERAEAVINTFKADIKSHVETNGSKYELIEAHDAFDLVYEVIEKNYENTKEMMTIDEACQLVDNHLENEAKKLLGLNRFKQATSTDRPHDERRPTGAELKTLTNQSVAASSESSSEYLSDEESKRRIAAKIKWV